MNAVENRVACVKNNAAYIIERINDIWKQPPGKKILQKLVFLIEEKGIDLKYEYGLHFYGPYSGSLDAATTFLSADGVIRFDYSGYAHEMSINHQKFDVLPVGLSRDQEAEIDNLIAHFKDRSASDLELLTTAIYVYNHSDDKTAESIIKGVQKVKGSKYSPADIHKALEDFAYFHKNLAS